MSNSIWHNKYFLTNQRIRKVCTIQLQCIQSQFPIINLGVNDSSRQRCCKSQYGMATQSNRMSEERSQNKFSTKLDCQNWKARRNEFYYYCINEDLPDTATSVFLASLIAAIYPFSRRSRFQNVCICIQRHLSIPSIASHGAP